MVDPVATHKKWPRDVIRAMTSQIHTYENGKFQFRPGLAELGAHPL